MFNKEVNFFLTHLKNTKKTCFRRDLEAKRGGIPLKRGGCPLFGPLFKWWIGKETRREGSHTIWQKEVHTHHCLEKRFPTMLL